MILGIMDGLGAGIRIQTIYHSNFYFGFRFQGENKSRGLKIHGVLSFENGLWGYFLKCGQSADKMQKIAKNLMKKKKDLKPVCAISPFILYYFNWCPRRDLNSRPTD